MWYVEFLRARKALGIYGLFVLFLALVAIVTHIYETSHHHGEHFEAISVEGYAYVAAAMVAVFSTVLATSLAHHLAGHLEIAWTKPIARERLILETMIVDAVTIAIAYVGTIFVAIGLVSLFAGEIFVSVTPLGLGRTAIELLFIFAFYSVIQAVTSGQRRMAATVAGVAWPVLLLLLAAPSMRMPAPITRSIELLNYLNPLALLAVRTNDGFGTNMLRMQIWGVPALLDACALIALGLAIAIVRWRQIEV